MKLRFLATPAVLHLTGFAMAVATLPTEEVQLTFDSYNHALDNNDNFSPDDKWLVYDTRTEAGGIQAGRTIEKVHTQTREIVIVYSAPGAAISGPGVGAASYHPTRNRIVFIHGLLNHSLERPYAQWRRFGMLVDEDNPNVNGPVDARDVQLPFTAGALRGGTHRHEFSADGGWIGFTYNDALLAAKGEQFNLRTIGVTRTQPGIQLKQRSNGTNFHGSGTSALVVRVTPNPRPGSNDISRAAWDSWIGSRGYLTVDGSWQRARAFLGTVRTKQGDDVQELFVVDIPEQISVPGKYGPLEGTQNEMPMPPAGATQRRISHSTDRRHPGFSGIVRSSPDGSQLACLGKDDRGVDQVVLASSRGGDVVQLTRFDSPVQSDVRWHPGGEHVCFVQGNTLMVANVTSGHCAAVCKAGEHSPFAPVWNHQGNMIAYNRPVLDATRGTTFDQIFIVALEPDELP